MEEKKRGFMITKDIKKELLKGDEFYPVSLVKEDLETEADEFVGYIINDGMITPCFKDKLISDKFDEMGITESEGL